jgi:copper chaperone CopZ
MKIKSLFAFALIAVLGFTACKEEIKKKEASEVNKETAIAKMETVSLNISGMTCEIGCAKKIQSDLSKADGVASAKVVFADSLATVQFDANTTSKEKLIKLVNGIAGGEAYTATEVEKVAAEK